MIVYDFRDQVIKGIVDSSLLSFAALTLAEAGMSSHEDAQAALWRTHVRNWGLFATDSTHLLTM